MSDLAELHKTDCLNVMQLRQYLKQETDGTKTLYMCNENFLQDSTIDNYI